MKTNINKIIIGITFSIIIFALMITLFFYIIINLKLIESYKQECESLGGGYWECANVTCKLFYDYCASQCSLNGHQYNYYDGDLCALDCKVKNEEWKRQGSNMRCVC